MVKLLLIFFGCRELRDCMSVGSRSLLIVPVNVISPLLTVAVTPGKSLVASVTPLLSSSSPETVTGAVEVLVSGVVVVVVVVVSAFFLLPHDCTVKPTKSVSAKLKETKNLFMSLILKLITIISSTLVTTLIPRYTPQSLESALLAFSVARSGAGGAGFEPRRHSDREGHRG
jgi:hypothetical protein